MVKKRYKKYRTRFGLAFRVKAAAAFMFLFCILLYAASSFADNHDSEEVTDSVEDESSPEVTLIAVGDVIAHDTILNLASTGNGYDFTSLFSVLKSDISSVDLSIANLETVLGGEDDGRYYTGYPAFNTPDEMGDALIDAGFNVITEASNHSMDAGSAAVHHAISYWSEHSGEALMIGLYNSKEDADEIHTVTINGIKIALLNYTQMINAGYEVPDDEPYLVAMMTEDKKDYISAQIKQASDDADFVIVLPHWGTEDNVGEPDESQKEWAVFFAEAGADLILGTHPHVIETIEWVEADNGNRALCYYSLGNFVSNQQDINEVLGGMAYLTILQDETGTYINDSSAKVIPVVTHNDKTGDPYVIQTYYLADYTDEFASVHDTKLNYDYSFSVETLEALAQNVFGSRIIDRIP